MSSYLVPRPFLCGCELPRAEAFGVGGVIPHGARGLLQIVKVYSLTWSDAQYYSTPTDIIGINADVKK